MAAEGTEKASITTRVGERIRRIPPRARETGLRIRQGSADARVRLEAYARDEPVKAIILAAVAGLVLGKLLSLGGKAAKKRLRPRKRETLFEWLGID